MHKMVLKVFAALLFLWHNRSHCKCKPFQPTQWNIYAENNSANGIHIKIYDENADPLTYFIAKLLNVAHKIPWQFWFSNVFSGWGFGGDSGVIGERDILTFSFSDSRESLFKLPKSCARNPSSRFTKTTINVRGNFPKMKHATVCNAVKTSKNYDGNNKISHLLQHNSLWTQKREKNWENAVREKPLFFVLLKWLWNENLSRCLWWNSIESFEQKSQWQ